jgi:hypothetical protein
MRRVYPDVFACRYIRAPIPFLAVELGFNVEDDKKTDAENTADAISDILAFLTQHNAALFANPNALDKDKMLDCKPCHEPLSKVYEEKYRKTTIEKRI